MEKLQKYIQDTEEELKQNENVMEQHRSDLQVIVDEMSELLAELSLLQYNGNKGLAKLKNRLSEKNDEMQLKSKQLTMCEKKYYDVRSFLMIVRIMANNPEKYAHVIANIEDWQNEQE